MDQSERVRVEKHLGSIRKPSLLRTRCESRRTLLGIGFSAAAFGNIALSRALHSGVERVRAAEGRI